MSSNCVKVAALLHNTASALEKERRQSQSVRSFFKISLIKPGGGDGGGRGYCLWWFAWLLGEVIHGPSQPCDCTGKWWQMSAMNGGNQVHDGKEEGERKQGGGGRVEWSGKGGGAQAGIRMAFSSNFLWAASKGHLSVKSLQFHVVVLLSTGGCISLLKGSSCANPAFYSSYCMSTPTDNVWGPCWALFLLFYPCRFTASLHWFTAALCWQEVWQEVLNSPLPTPTPQSHQQTQRDYNLLFESLSIHSVPEGRPCWGKKVTLQPPLDL